MAQELALFGDRTIPVPAHIQQAFTETNIVERDTLPTLTFVGKVWTINVNGEKTKLMRVDPEDGEEYPLANISVIVLEYAKERGRNYHEGAYDPDNTSAPKCWSTDSITPDESVPEPVNPKCATCPMSQKGSRISDNGKAVVACAQHRLVAVVPSKRLDMEPLRLKLPVTSDYDGQSKDLQAAGKFAFSNFLEFIKLRGVMHTAALVTKVQFDSAQAYPKLLFSPQRWLTEAELAKVKELRAGGGVEAILGASGEVRKKLAKPEQAAAGATTQGDVDGAATRQAAEAERTQREAAAALKEAQEREKAEAAAKAEKERKAAAAKAKKEKDAADKAAAEKSKASSTGNGTVATATATASDFSEDDDDGAAPATTAAPDKPKTNGGAAAVATKAVTEAEPVGDLPEGTADLLQGWAED